jgi:hypothetical protein
MNINASGIAAGFQGYMDEKQRLDEEARRTKADQRFDQDAAFQDETRQRQRKEWARTDKILSDDEADRLAIQQQFDPTTATAAPAPSAQTGAVPANPEPSSPPPIATPSGIPASLPAEVASVRKLDAAYAAGALPTATRAATTATAATAAPSGLPKPYNFNSALDQQLIFLNSKMARGTLSATDYTNAVSQINRMKSEGIHDALALMGQGRYDEGVAQYNNTGLMRGARVVSGKEGMTKINGQDVPTHFVTVQNADGSQTVMDVAKAQYQMLDMDRQLQHVDKARQTDMQRDHFAGTLALERARLAQQTSDAAANRDIQRQHLLLAQKQMDLTTPSGKIAELQKVLGRSLTMDEVTNMVGLDSLPPAIKMQLSSIYKEMDQNSQALAKAQTDPSWIPDSPGAKQMAVRNAVLTMQAAKIIDSLHGPAQAGTGSGQATGLSIPAPATAPNSPPVPVPVAKRLAVGGIPTSAPPAAMLPVQAGITAARQEANAAQAAKDDAVYGAGWSARREALRAKMDAEDQAKRLAESRADNDPELIALQSQYQTSLRLGRAVAANNALAKLVDLKKSRYGL